MNSTKKEIRDILKKLDDELHELDAGINIHALTQISADHKDILEVIQYFEQRIDSIRTQNEALQDIFRDTIRDMLNIKEKMADDIISNNDLKKELDEIVIKLENAPIKVNKSLFQIIKETLNKIITPKIALVSLAVILILSVFIFMPDKTIQLVEKVGTVKIK